MIKFIHHLVSYFKRIPAPEAPATHSVVNQQHPKTKNRRRSYRIVSRREERSILNQWEQGLSAFTISRNFRRPIATIYAVVRCNKKGNVDGKEILPTNSSGPRQEGGSVENKG
jgi:hypothetical protein